MPQPAKTVVTQEIAHAAVEAWKKGATVPDLVTQHAVDRSKLGAAMLKIVGGRAKWADLRATGAGGGRIRNPASMIQRKRVPSGSPSPSDLTAAFTSATCEWAASEAVREWDGEEGRARGRLIGAVATSADDLTLFRNFLHKWGIARSTTFDNKVPIFEAFVLEWRPQWSGSVPGDANGFAVVERAAAQIQRCGWSDSRLTSLASKLAFMSNPLTFAPYDKTVRKALRRRGYRGREHDYRRYMEAFLTVRDANASLLGGAASAVAAPVVHPASPDLLLMRLADKALMREGDFRGPDRS